VLDGRIIAAARLVQDGPAVDVTDAIHPDNTESSSAQPRRWSAGVRGDRLPDRDIARSWREAGGGVLGLDTLPDLRRHWLAHPGRGVLEPILARCCRQAPTAASRPAPSPAASARPSTANMVARILGTMGLVVRRCTTAGRHGRRRAAADDDCAGGWHARNLLFDRRVEAGVFELARGGLLNEGMVIDEVRRRRRAQHLRQPRRLGRHRRPGRPGAYQVDRRAPRPPHARAQTPRTRCALAMRKGARPTGSAWSPRMARAPALRAHIAAGGCAVIRRGSPGGDVIRAGRSWRRRSGAGDDRDPGNALRPAWRQGVERDVRGGHCSGDGRLARPDPEPACGRSSPTSLIRRVASASSTGFRFRVILDYGPAAKRWASWPNAVRQMPLAGRKLIYLMGSGRSSDDFLRATGRAVAGAFDLYVCTTGPVARDRMLGPFRT